MYLYGGRKGATSEKHFMDFKKELKHKMVTVEHHGGEVYGQVCSLKIQNNLMAESATHIIKK